MVINKVHEEEHREYSSVSYNEKTGVTTWYKHYVDVKLEATFTTWVVFEEEQDAECKLQELNNE